MNNNNLDLQNIADYRRTTGLNQSKFWQLFGYTQSGGSRFEAGREIPDSVSLLLIFHSQGILTDEDLKQAASDLASHRAQ